MQTEKWNTSFVRPTIFLSVVVLCALNSRVVTLLTMLPPALFVLATVYLDKSIELW